MLLILDYSRNVNPERKKSLKKNVIPGSTVCTDEHGSYQGLGISAPPLLMLDAVVEIPFGHAIGLDECVEIESKRNAEERIVYLESLWGIKTLEITNFIVSSL